MRSLLRFLLGFFDARIPLLFVAGAILLELVSSAVYDLVREGTGSPLAVLVLLIGSFCLFLVVAVLFTLIARRLKPKLALSVPGTPVPRREGLIALVSYGRLSDIPATAAIQYHLGGTDGRAVGPLCHCWLIATKPPDQEARQATNGVGSGLGETPQSSARNAVDLRERYKQDLKTIEVITIADADDPEETFVAVEEAYRRARKHHGLHSSQIIADFTGGTKSMTAGMVLGCTGPDRHLEYMKPRKYLPDGRADPEAGSEGRLVDIHFFLRTGVSEVGQEG